LRARDVLFAGLVVFDVEVAAGAVLLAGGSAGARLPAAGVDPPQLATAIAVATATMAAASRLLCPFDITGSRASPP
jgi:hypothetical protein